MEVKIALDVYGKDDMLIDTIVVDSERDGDETAETIFEEDTDVTRIEMWATVNRYMRETQHVKTLLTKEEKDE